MRVRSAGEYLPSYPTPIPACLRVVVLPTEDEDALVDDHRRVVSPLLRAGAVHLRRYVVRGKWQAVSSKQQAVATEGAAAGIHAEQVIACVWQTSSTRMLCVTKALNA